MATLPRAWHYRISSWTFWPGDSIRVTGWDSKFDLQFLSKCGSTCTCLSRSVPDILQHGAWTFSKQPTTTTSSLAFSLSVVLCFHVFLLCWPIHLHFYITLFNEYHSPKLECENLVRHMSKNLTNAVTPGGLARVVVVGCLTSRQHAGIPRGRICLDRFTRCHTEKGGAHSAVTWNMGTNLIVSRSLCKTEVMIACGLYKVPATCEMCLRGGPAFTMYILPHWKQTCRSNLLFHLLKAHWRKINHCYLWLHTTRCLKE